MGKSASAGRIVLLLSLVAIPVAYVLTLARVVVYGDPTEYTFVANILGIAHPPGYAFYTLLGKLFQTLIPIGDVPWRMHLLSAAAATTGAPTSRNVSAATARGVTASAMSAAATTSAIGAYVATRSGTRQRVREGCSLSLKRTSDNEHSWRRFTCPGDNAP